MLALLLTGAAALWAAQGARVRPTPPAGGFTLAGDRVRPARSPLRVATFNLAGGVGRDGREDLSRAAAALRDFDLVALEEVHGRSPLSNQAHALADADGYSWLFAPSELQWWGLKHFGNGVLSTLPVEQWSRLPIASAASRTNRSCVVLRAGYRGVPLHVVLAHLDRHEDHDAELQTVIALFDDLAAPALLMGDLNTVASDRQLDALDREDGVVNCLRLGTDGHVPADNVDWIFAKGLRCAAAGFSDNGASDHHLAWADVVLEDRAAQSVGAGKKGDEGKR